MNKNNKKKNMFKKFLLITLGTLLCFASNVSAGAETVINVNDLEVTLTRSIGEEFEIYEVEANKALKLLDFQFSDKASFKMSRETLSDPWTVNVVYNNLDITETKATDTIIEFIEDEVPDLTLTIAESGTETVATFTISKTISDQFFNKIMINHDPFTINAESLGDPSQKMKVIREIDEGTGRDKYIFSSESDVFRSAKISEGDDQISINKTEENKFVVGGLYNGDPISEIEKSLPSIIEYDDLELCIDIDEETQGFIISPNAALIEEIKERLLKEKQKITYINIPTSGEIDISEYPDLSSIDVVEGVEIVFGEQNGEVKINNELTINSTIANGMKIIFYPGTVITGLDNDRRMVMPKVASVTPEVDEGYTPIDIIAIEVGLSGQTIQFTNPVKLVFPGKAGMKAGFVKNGFNEINDCESGFDIENPTLNPNSECKIDSGSDLFVFTRHFTEFVVYTQTANSSGSGTGGGDVEYNLISNVSIAKTENSATITFTTSDSATSIIKYGTSQGSYTQTLEDSETKTSHSFTLTGLSAGNYYYQIEASNGADSDQKTGSFTISAIEENSVPESVTLPPSSDTETSTKIKEQKTYNYNGIITTKPLTEMNKNELFRLLLMLILKSLLAQRGITL